MKCYFWPLIQGGGQARAPGCNEGSGMAVKDDVGTVTEFDCGPWLR